MARYLLFLLIVCAQAQAQPLFRVSVPWAVVGVAQVQQYQKSGSQLWAEGQYEYTSSDAKKSQLAFGYEYLLTPKWLLGANYVRLANNNAHQWGLSASAKHNGRVGKIIFLKEISLSYIEQRSRQEGNWQFGGAVYVGKRFQMLGLPWQGGMQLNATKLRNVVGDARRISHTQSMLALDCGVHKAVALRLFLAKTTDYYFGLAQDRYDSQGNLIESIPYHKLNRVQPIVGFSVRFLMKTANQNAEAPFNIWNVGE